MIGLHKNKIMLCEYDESWDEAYEKEKERLLKLLDEKIAKVDKIPRIEHVGSTALTTLSKPIIDIALVIDDEEEYQNVYSILRNYGYDIVENKNNCEIVAWKGLPENRTHCIYLFFGDDKKFNEMVMLRDYLNENRYALNKYKRFKASIMEEMEELPSREQYEKLKNEYLSDLLTELLAKMDN